MAAYLNKVATAIPDIDIHLPFLEFASGFMRERRDRLLFDRMASKSQIEHRWSVLGAAGEPEAPLSGPADFYTLGEFPGTGRRMEMYEQTALPLAVKAVEGLNLGADLAEVTHLIVVSCTGFSAPGLDLQILQRCGLKASTERTIVGFMGCYAAMNAMRLARHMVRSDAQARVLIVSVELCTLHLQEPASLEAALSFMVFGDGCAAALVSSDPVGFSLDRFQTLLAPDAADHITWNIRDSGFEMFLSGQVPGSISTALRAQKDVMLEGSPIEDFELWAVHPGGRSVLDAVENALELPQGALSASRDVLRRFGNMSSATVLFVLKELLATSPPQARGCAMAFGPGLTAETLLFTSAG